MSIVVRMIITVVADEADGDGGQQGEDEALNEADEQLEEIEGRQEVHRVKEVFTAEYVAEKTHRKGHRTDEDRNDFDETGNDEDQREAPIHGGSKFLLVGLVAEEVL